MILKFLNDLLRPLMTFDVILHFMKILRLYNVSIHGNFYEHKFKKSCVRKEKNKIPELPESRFFCETRKNLRS